MGLKEMGRKKSMTISLDTLLRNFIIREGRNEIVAGGESGAEKVYCFKKVIVF